MTTESRFVNDAGEKGSIPQRRHRHSGSPPGHGGPSRGGRDLRRTIDERSRSPPRVIRTPSCDPLGAACPSQAAAARQPGPRPPQGQACCAGARVRGPPPRRPRPHGRARPVGVTQPGHAARSGRRGRPGRGGHGRRCQPARARGHHHRPHRRGRRPRRGGSRRGRPCSHGAGPVPGRDLGRGRRRRHRLRGAARPRSHRGRRRNTARLHGALGDVPPDEFEAAFYAAQQADPAGVGIQQPEPPSNPGRFSRGWRTRCWLGMWRICR